MSIAGLSELQIEHYLKSEQKRQEDMHLRALAFTEWLITDPRFLKERDAFRRVWEDRVAEDRSFPVYRLSFLGEQPKPTGQEEARLFQFYRRWGLHTFFTWEVPVPMPPQFDGVVYHDTVTLAGAGLHLFLPWYLLRDNRLSLQELAKQLKKARPPKHLDGWFARAAGDSKRLGYTRLTNTFVLRWCWQHALAARYADRFTRQTERLDRALACYLHLGEDSVKKLRLSMVRAR